MLKDNYTIAFLCIDLIIINSLLEFGSIQFSSYESIIDYRKIQNVRKTTHFRLYIDLLLLIRWVLLAPELRGSPLWMPCICFVITLLCLRFCIIKTEQLPGNWYLKMQINNSSTNEGQLVNVPTWKRPAQHYWNVLLTHAL